MVLPTALLNYVKVWVQCPASTVYNMIHGKEATHSNILHITDGFGRGRKQGCGVIVVMDTLPKERHVYTVSSVGVW